MAKIPLINARILIHDAGPLGLKSLYERSGMPIPLFPVVRIAIGVVGSNSRALRFYENLGFKREGLQRDGYYYDHHYEDFVMMSMLENEYREHNKKGVPD